MAAKILIYKTSGGGISCKVNLDNDSHGVTYHRGSGKLFRWNRGEDRKEYPLIVSFSYLDAFLGVNKVNYKTVEIDKNSIDVFYGYSIGNKNIYFTNLSQSNVDKWWNYDAPELYRYSVNKDRHTNMFGLNLIYFSNQLVEWGWGGTYVDEDITQEEVEKLTKGHETTHIAEEMWRVLNAQKLSEGEVEFLVEEVKKYEEQIQAVIDKHKDEILASTAGMIDGTYGLDCGFLNVYTKNPQYNERKGLLKNRHKDIGRTQWLHVSMPRFAQSLTIQEKQFEKVKEIVFRELGEELYCKTMLD